MLVLLAGVVILPVHFAGTSRRDAVLERMMAQWRGRYHLNDDQIVRIKQIELDFHGSGSPFSIRPNYSKDEQHRHHEEISRQMSPDDGVRFMQAMERSDGAH